MTRAEYKALRAEYRQQWSAGARLAHERAQRNLRRFIIFCTVMVLIAGVVGAMR